MCQHGECRPLRLVGTQPKLVALLEQPIEQSNFISAHLGNGCSVCAIKNGKSVDTSMGLTPLAGLVMGTRSGDIDPGLFNFLTTQLNYDAKQIDNLLNKESGLLGISELSNDCRTIEEAAVAGHEKAALALDIFCYRLAKQIAAYMVPLQQLDALIFTGGIGENSALVRAKTIEHLLILGFSIDENLNSSHCHGKAIHSTDSRPIMVIPTDEEVMIVQDTLELIAGTI